MSDFSDLVILTTKELKQVEAEDLILVEELKKENLRVRLQNWEDYKPMPQSEASVLFRSTWGYHKSIKEFKGLLKAMSQTNLQIWNPLNLIRWNLNKRYLLELRRKGLPVIPTRILEPTHVLDFQSLSSEFGTDSFVLKPAISAGGEQTYHILMGDTVSLNSAEVNQLRKENVLVQPFIQGIAEEGELSLIFIENEFTHCVLKQSDDNDFRVQEQFGGSSEKVAPPPAALRVAKEILEKLEEEPLYARVDLVRSSRNHFQLMELELIEPRLWFNLEPRAASVMAHAISKRL